MVTQQEMNYLEAMEQELNEANRVKRQLSNTQLSMFGMPSDENLIRWQLDFKEDLDRIYHLLKGTQIKEDDKGNMVYLEPEDEALKPFSEFGTQLIMNIMSFYLNRNLILSNYDEETINSRVHDFGIELIDLIFNRYEEMMMTTSFTKEFKKIYGIFPEELEDGRLAVKTKVNGEIQYQLLSVDMIHRVNSKLQEHLLGKMKLYPMIVLEIVDNVNSAYNRALHGEEKKSLREARTVTQNEPLMKQQNIPMISQPKNKSMLNPFSWFRP